MKISLLTVAVNFLVLTVPMSPDTCTGLEPPQCCSIASTDSTSTLSHTDSGSTTEFDLDMSGTSKNNYFPVMLHTLWISIALVFTWIY